jgi:hypothetical protein
MKTPLLAALAAVLVLGSCGTVRESRLNPFNWFGRSTEQAGAAVVPGATSDGREPVAQVTDLAVEVTAGGAIIRATGLPPSQGHWNGALVREPTEAADELRFRFVVARPPLQRPAGTPQSREVTVATYLSDIRLEQIRRITVAGAQNARTTTRR